MANHRRGGRPRRTGSARQDAQNARRGIFGAISGGRGAVHGDVRAVARSVAAAESGREGGAVTWLDWALVAAFAALVWWVLRGLWDG